MEHTFITIHDLSGEARILYASDSVVDVLGFTPDEVVNRPCWDFFHPNDIDEAKRLHSRGIELDKAAVLVYCKLTHRDRRDPVVCECCFTCVYNVMVVCTSVYQPGIVSQQRATEAPIIRRLFSASPLDPRYHMLSHLSTKFQRDVTQDAHEPRAALFLNRFTRTATIMYATSGIEQVIGSSGEDLKGRSFYYCIAENCLNDAVTCLETAKCNNSIAYLRFWYRDPRQDDQATDVSDAETGDAEMTDVTDTEDEDHGGVRLDVIPPPPLDSSTSASGSGSGAGSVSGSGENPRERTGAHSAETEVGPSQPRVVPQGHTPTTPTSSGSGEQRLELEAVVSCTSDGLVVILRRARPMMPAAAPARLQTGRPIQYGPPQGMFAAPWAPEPMFIPEQPRPTESGWYHGMHPLRVQPPAAGATGPSPQDFMNSIREVAVFAWALVGINGSLANYGRGTPAAGSQPRELQIWERQGIDSGHVTGTESTTSPVPFGQTGPGGLAHG